jgi:site-specific DNA-methyltransferase (adenine-specific)
VRSGDLTLPKAKKAVEKAHKEDERRKAAEEGARAAEERGENLCVLMGDFATVLADVPDASVDLIFTDPPYDDDSLPLYESLAKQGARLLKDGGSLITYVGQNILPAVLPAMVKHLRWWWQLTVRHKGGSQRLPGKFVLLDCKALLWFVKHRRRCNNYVAVLIESEAPDKSKHDWSQSTKEASYLIERLTVEGELVLDPMCGAGTTLAAALKLKRRALGIEIDPDRANVAWKRLADLRPGRGKSAPANGI